jgi:hypothetical protein
MMTVLAGMVPAAKQKVRVIQNPQHTRNLFGPIEEIAGKELEVLERNSQGDCLCLFTGIKGTNIVDVDHRDVFQNAQVRDAGGGKPS